MKSLLLLNCYLFLIGYALADDEGCNIDGIPDFNLLTLRIDDTEINTAIGEYEYEGTLAVLNYTDNDYFVVTNNDTHFIVKTNTEFENYDERTPKQVNDFVLEKTINCYLECSGETNRLTIQITVIDINTHPPKFALDQYEYSVASPIMPLTDFTIYGDFTILATDIDFSNQDIVFSVQPDDFSIDTISTSDSKEYSAVFSARRVIQLTDNLVYTITATDSGTNPGPLSSSTTITLKLDEATSLDAPSFDSVSYAFNYTIVDNEPHLIDRDGPITIVTNKLSSLTDPILEGEFASLFTADIDKTSGVITLATNGLLPAEAGSFLILTLSVSTDNRASTSIVVYTSQSDNDDTPRFSNRAYTGQYNDVTASVQLDEDIQIASTTTPVVTISGEYSDRFEVAYNDATTSYSISVFKNLTGPEIKSLPFLNLIISASVGDNFDTAAVILSLPEHELQFTNASYSASYNSDNTVTVDDTHPIKFTTDVGEVQITIDGIYADNFDIKYNSENKQYSLEVDIPLTSDILKEEIQIVLILTASDTYGNEAQSFVTIILPSINTDAPIFSETVYLVEYVDDVDSPLAPNEEITISNRDNQADIKITLDSYEGNFEVVYDATEDKWKLKLLAPLPDDVLQSRNDLLIVMTAEEPDNTNQGHAVLSVSWITKEAPMFTKAYYLGYYPKDGVGTIEMDEDIDFSNVEDPDTVDITLDNYAEYFEIKYNSGKWMVSIILETPIITDNTELVIILTATEKGNKQVGESVLVLQLPEEETPPMFADAYYLAEYPDSGEGIIEFANPIEFLNVNNLATIQINLDNYASNFEIKYDSNRWFINIISSLDESVLHRNIELVMTLTATEEGNSKHGESALILTLPTASSGTAPKFSDAYYTAEYPESGTGVIEFENAVSFSNIDDPKSVTITLDSYEKNFDIIFDDIKGWYINIKESLEEEVLQRTELVATLIAKEIGSNNQGESALVLKLPTTTDEKAPKFLEAYYVAQYPKSGKGYIEFETPIGFSNVETESDLTINLYNYANNFEIIYESSKWVINIKEGLDDSILNDNVELVMTLVATTKSDSVNKGRSALVLNLPTATDKAAPEFEDAYYLAEYPSIPTDVIEFEKTVHFTNIDEPQNLDISLDNYLDNFDIVYDSDRWYILVKKNLDKSILDKNAEIVLTMTATENGNINKGHSALILKLPTVTDITAPKFSETYYLANYPKSGSGSIEFEIPIEFTNVDDPLDVKISLTSYSSNFEVKYDTRWYIDIIQGLDEATLNRNVELVMTLTATRSVDGGEGYATLVMKLPVASRGPEFADTYYLAQYPKNDEGIIEFEKPVTFLNLDDVSDIKIVLDSYSTNFEIIYDKDANRWYINIKQRLEDGVLQKNSELVITMIATETGNENEGKSVLVLELPAVADESGPVFSKAYYEAEYTDDGTGKIEFETDVSFKNVDDPTTVTINLDNYSENFGIVYGSDGWYIQLINVLDEDVLLKNAEIVMTLIATTVEDGTEGYSALVLKLPSANNVATIEFSEAFYKADYSKITNDTIEFEHPITFLNVIDPTTVTISLDNYSDNFKITYDTDRWFITVTKELDNDVLTKNAELVMTMMATENEKQATSALVLKLPALDDDSALIFSEAFYEAEYVENDNGFIEFESPIEFLNVEDPKTVTINLDTYTKNFNIMYGSNGWVIKLKANLEDSVLMKNTELVITMTATQTGREGRAALVLKLPSANTVTAPKFSEAYYLADYSKITKETIEFESPVTFSNVKDPTTITINLDLYADNFEIKYNTETSRWYINIKDTLDSTVLNENYELVMAMIATETGNEYKGESALVLKLPAVVNEERPIFSEIYYEAEYKADDDGIIEFEHPIEFLNVDDSTTVTISLDYYSSNFDIKYGGNRWYIQLKTELDDNVLIKNTEIVMAMTASATEFGNKGYSALVLKLPTANIATAPRFSEVYYLADYSKITNGKIELENPITFLNVQDLATITISLDYYYDNFDVIYDAVASKWYIKVNSVLDSNVLNKNAELVITMIATEAGNDNTGKSALVLKLPPVTDETSPIFSEAYYEAEYTEEENRIIEFETPIAFLNVDNIKDVTIQLDNYATYFDVTYGLNRWYIYLKTNLDESILTRNTELVITMAATTTSNNNPGRAALVLKLPSANSVKAPKFSKSYYLADYSKMSDEIIEFESPVRFLNVDDPATITINLDSYSNNFEIAYDKDKTSWYININNKLDNSVLSNNAELVITMTATETGNDNKGESVLVLKLPSINSDTGPIFSKAHYEVEYVDDEIGILEFETALTFINVVDPATVTINLDSTYSSNFDILYSSERWYIRINTKLDESILKKNTEIVMTMTATVTDNKNEGHSALVLKLPSAKSVLAPKFSEAYYTADYSKISNGFIEFEDPVAFLNIDNLLTLTINLDNYADNFEITYDPNPSKWYINIINPLSSSVLEKNAELVITMIATEVGNDNEGESALVLKLPTVTDETAPIFSEAYYEAKYIEDGTGIIEFENSIMFLNIDDPTTLTINLDNYSTNFEIIYDSNKWYIGIKTNLDENVLMRNTEIVMTMTTSWTKNKNTGHSALVIKLPSANSVTAPKFSEAYYIADYTKITEGIIEFENPITFLNVKDPRIISINLDSYSNNFDISYNTDTASWYINVNDRLDTSVLNKNAELVMAMIASEAGNDNKGVSALVLKLPTITDETGPIFSEAYYEAKYVEDGTGFIDFENAITFLNVDDPTTVTINLNNYASYLDVTYVSSKWRMELKQNLDNGILLKNTEIVVTMTATSTNNKNEGHSALILKLPSADTVTAPKFSEAYYLADYAKLADGVVEFEHPITFSNVDDPAAVTISLDNYSDKFEIAYDSDGDRWYIHVINNLDDSVLSKNSELVMTMTAAVSDNKNKGFSVLVLKLTENQNEIAPIFSEVYYLVDYPENGKVNSEIEIPITFKNIDDPSKITIKLDKYTSNFEVVFTSDKWYINIVTPLDDSVVTKNTELVMTLIATETDKTSEGYAALVLKMPEVSAESPPIFSKAYYAADYKIVDGKALVEFSDVIDITNKPDLTAVSITADNYDENFEISYDDVDKVWVMNVIEPISDEILLSKTDIIVAITATDINNELTDQSIVYLTLPPLNTVSSPKFSKTYYTATYAIVGATPIVTFDVALSITNREQLTDISIGTDNYQDNFKIEYDAASNEWKMIVIDNLDEAVLNAKVDLVMALLATDKDTGEIGESALVLRLPIVNNDAAPKFSRIHYSGEYLTDNGGRVELEDVIEITNKIDFTTITISFDDSYKNNFEINYDASNSKWVLNTISPLNDLLLKDSHLILTLTATEEDNPDIGQAALLLNLPLAHLKLAPKFARAHYSAEYVVEDDQASISLSNTITIENKEDLNNISVSLDSYSTNFNVNYDSSKEEWSIGVVEPLLDDVLNSNTELILTLIATERDNENAGDATLILALPSSSDNSTEGDLVFSQVHYAADYNVEGNTVAITMNDTIKITTKLDVTKLTVSFQNDLYADYFDIIQDSDSYTVAVKKPLTSDVLDSEVSIVLTIVAEIDSSKGYATLIINLPRSVQDRAIEFASTLYTGTYNVEDGSFQVIDVILVKTDIDDTNVARTISSNTGYEMYFEISYSAKIVTVTLKQEIPTDLLKGRSIIPLLLTVRITGTTDSSTAVLNVEIQNKEDDNDDDNGNNLRDNCPVATAYIISIVILCVMIIALVAAGVAFYYLKIRNRSYANLDEERDSRTRYDKNTPTRASADTKHNPIEERRPTGFIFKPLDEDTKEAINDFDKNRRKSVAFDDNVEKMQIESPIDEDNISEYDNNIADKNEVTHV